MDEEGNQFVAYFLPNEDTLRKRKRDVEEELDYMPEELYDPRHKHTHTQCPPKMLFFYTPALLIG